MSQSRTVPEQPKVVCNLLISVSWSMLSKAADRSSSVKIGTCLLPEAGRRSFTTQNKAVSVLWHFRYADWKGTRRL